MSIIYRQAVLADLSVVVDLLRKLYEEHHTTEELLVEAKAFLGSPSQAFFLANTGVQAVGVAHVSLQRGTHNDVCSYLEARTILPVGGCPPAGMG